MIAAISPVISPRKNGTNSKRSRRWRSSTRASAAAEKSSGPQGTGPPVPAVEGGELARVPGLAQPGRAQVVVRPDLAEDLAQVAPEVGERGAPPEPVAVVDRVHDEPGPEDQGVG